MKPATVVSVAAVLLFGGVTAKNGYCTGGTLYCGKTLKNIGKFLYLYAKASRS